MILLLSDAHFGKGSPADERAKEADLIQLIDAHADEIEGLYLLGDIFDQFIEYKHLLPKGFVRFQATLARLTEAGTPVVYLVGNHDPWHLDYFHDELGVNIVRDFMEVSVGGLRLFLSHGDGLERGAVSAAVHRMTRHPVSMMLYRTLLPADFGYRFAKFTKNRLETSDEPNPVVIERLRDAARRTLAERRVPVVVLAHSHRPELVVWPEGVYVNTGSWHRDRSVCAVEWNADIRGGTDTAKDTADATRPTADVTGPPADVTGPPADATRPLAGVAGPTAGVTGPPAGVTGPTAVRAGQTEEASRPGAAPDVSRDSRARGRIRLGKWNERTVSWYSEFKIEASGNASTAPSHNTNAGRSFGVFQRLRPRP